MKAFNAVLVDVETMLIIVRTLQIIQILNISRRLSSNIFIYIQILNISSRLSSNIFIYIQILNISSRLSSNIFIKEIVKQ